MTPSGDPIKLPLILVDTRDEVTIFSSADMVSMHLEAQDVLNGEYRLFDCAGLEYPLSAESDNSPVLVGGSTNREPSFDLVRDIASRLLSRPRSEFPTTEDVSRALAAAVDH